MLLLICCVMTVLCMCQHACLWYCVLVPYRYVIHAIYLIYGTILYTHTHSKLGYRYNLQRLGWHRGCSVLWVMSMNGSELMTKAGRLLRVVSSHTQPGSS